MHGQTLTLLLCIVLGFTTWQGLNRSGVMERYLFSTEALRLRREWIRLVSPAFLHGSWMHFAGNAITLYFFGGALENAYGPGVLLGTFFLSVAGGHGVCLLLNRSGDYRAIGASGGALGILFSVILINPGMRIMLFPLPIPIPAWLYAIGYLVYTLQALRGISGVSHEAHLGGMLSGVAVTLLQQPRLFLEHPVLVSLILGAGAGGVAYLHLNPGRVPGFFRLLAKDGKAKLRSRRAQKPSPSVDEILDKVSRDGIHSLNQAERDLLQDASKRRRGRA